jgi:hypothetical protein
MPSSLSRWRHEFESDWGCSRALGPFAREGLDGQHERGFFVRNPRKTRAIGGEGWGTGSSIAMAAPRTPDTRAVSGS